MSQIERIENELRQCVEHRSRPNIDDIDAAFLLAEIEWLRAELKAWRVWRSNVLAERTRITNDLREQLAAAQAREAKLRDTLEQRIDEALAGETK